MNDSCPTQQRPKNNHNKILLHLYNSIIHKFNKFNKLISTNLAAIATFENERRKERQRQGIQAAKKNGKYLGRKTVITKRLIAQVQDLKENKKLSITEIAKITGRGRNKIYKVLKF